MFMKSECVPSYLYYTLITDCLFSMTSSGVFLPGLPVMGQ